MLHEDAHDDVEEFDPNVEDPEFDEPSNYNDAKGVRYNTIYFALEDPIVLVNRRRNAVPKPDVNFFYAHEEMAFEGWVYTMLKHLNKPQFRDFVFVDQDGKLHGGNKRPFKMEFTMPRFQKEKALLDTEAKFEDMVERAKRNSRPEVKVTITELEVVITALAPSQATASQAALDTAQTGEKRTREDGGEADESAKKAKKGDAADNQESDLEREVQMLRQSNLCNDNDCERGYCWIHPKTLKHVFLDWPNATLWSRAKMSGDDPAVTHTNPPDIPPFKRDQGTSILVEKRKQKLNVKQAPSPSATNVSSSSDVESLMKILLLDRLAQVKTAAISKPEEVQPGSSNAANNTVANTAPHPQAAIQQKRLSIMYFCERYGLSRTIEEKLRGNDISGPHCLRFITDSELQTVHKFTVGERADLRDAEERWTNGLD